MVFLKDIVEKCQQGTKIALLYGIHGTSEGEIGEEDKILIDCFSYAHKLVQDGDEKKEIIKEKGISIQSVVLKAENGSITNKKEMIEAIDAANIIVLSICYSHINELNTILRSEGIYAELILRQEYANIAGFDKGKLIQLDPVQKKILDKYLKNFPHIVLLIGHYGTGKTLLIIQMLGIRIGRLVLEGKLIQVIITADVSENSMLLRDLRDKYLGFIDNINDNQAYSNRVEVIIEPLSSLIKKYKAIPNTRSDLIILQAMSDHSLLNEDGWMKKDHHPGIKIALEELCDIDENNQTDVSEIVEELKEQSGYHGQTTPEWLQKELCLYFPVEQSNPVSVLRKFRQEYLFKKFLNQYFLSNGSSFIMDRLLPNLLSWDCEKHTLVMLDEFNACNADANWTPLRNTLLDTVMDVFIAVEPLSWPLFADQGRDGDSNCMIEFLPTKHRTCKPIDQFVSGAIREKGGLTMKSETSGPVKLDFHLEDRHHWLPQGHQPIWISFEALEQPEMERLQHFVQDLTKEYEDIKVISRLKRSMYKELCTRMKWVLANIKDIIGSEVSCLISFGIPSHQNLEELVSRARNRLIIVTEEKRY